MADPPTDDQNKPDDESGSELDDIERMLEDSYQSPDVLDAGELYGKWEVYKLADAYKPRPPRRYVINELLPYPSLSIVYGGPGSLKSMLLADLCLCAALGKKWLEPLPNKKVGITFTTNETGVLWIDFDNGRDRSHERFEAVGRGHGASDKESRINYVSMPDPWLDASNRSFMTEVSRLARYLDARLIVVDNLGLVSGATEENSGDMAKVMGNLRWLAEEAEAAVIVVHHQRKSASTATPGVRKGESLRGHSSIEASLDLALLVERKEGQDLISVTATKVRGYLEQNTFGAVFTYEHQPGTKELSRARFYAEQALSAEQAAIVKIENTVKNVLLAHGAMTQKDLVSEVRDTIAGEPGGTAPAINKVRGIIKQMAEGGSIDQSGSANGRMYSPIRGTFSDYRMP